MYLYVNYIRVTRANYSRCSETQLTHRSFMERRGCTGIKQHANKPNLCYKTSNLRILVPIQGYREGTLMCALIIDNVSLQLMYIIIATVLIDLDEITYEVIICILQLIL